MLHIRGPLEAESTARYFAHIVRPKPVHCVPYVDKTDIKEYRHSTRLFQHRSSRGDHPKADGTARGPGLRQEPQRHPQRQIIRKGGQPEWDSIYMPGLQSKPKGIPAFPEVRYKRKHTIQAQYPHRPERADEEVKTFNRGSADHVEGIREWVGARYLGVGEAGG